VTAALFFAYGDPLFLNMQPALNAALEQSHAVHIIPRPVFGDTDSSALAALFVYSAGRQGRFDKAHRLLAGRYRALDDAAVTELAQTLDLDMERLQADMKDPALQALIRKNERYVKVLRMRALPAFLVNGRILWSITGQVPSASDIRAVIEEGKLR